MSVDEVSHDRYLMLERLLEVRRYREAERVLAEAMVAEPDNPENHYYAARLAHEQEQWADAREELELLLRREPDHAPGRELLVHVAIAQKAYAEAEEVVTDLIRERPREPQYFAQYAYVMLLTLHLDRARALVDEALRLDPEHRFAGVLDVVISLIHGEKAAATDRLQALVRHDPEALHVSHTILMMLVNEHRYGPAFEMAREILRARPDSEDALRLTIELKAASHWLAWPARVVQPLGWAGSGLLWIGMVALISVLARTGHAEWSTVVGVVWVVYAIYTWVQQPLLRRYFAWRGF